MGDLHTVLTAGDYVAVGDGSGVHIEVGHVAGPDAPAAVGDDGQDQGSGAVGPVEVAAHRTYLDEEPDGAADVAGQVSSILHLGIGVA